MPLIDAKGVKADRFVGTVQPLDALDVTPADGANAVQAVLVPNTTPAAKLLPHLASLKLIAISFPAFSDGRGFSIAKQLRNAGFKGELRASGALIPDQFRQALAVGFDEIEIDEERFQRQPLSDWLESLPRQTINYQSGYLGGKTSILEARRAARGR
jgi:uncharacterized protein (DUF934 family)